MNVMGLMNYWAFIFLMMVGFYILISQGNLVKKIVGLNVFQTSVFILYISMGKIRGGTAPILTEGDPIYSNPLPHVLILTAIVVGVATTALGLSLVVRIHEAYGTVEEDDIHDLDLAVAGGEDQSFPVSGMDARA
ncbi:MAG: cation:proton antiporter subunit C [Gemmatimonadetes bacterium]|nr:cation:proton antiporter subunit C [Gemmatimonadota bacterium]